MPVVPPPYSRLPMNPIAVPMPQNQQIPGGENLAKAVILVVLLLGSFAMAQFTVAWLATADLASGTQTLLAGIALSVTAVWSCMLITGMGILAHDAVHRVLFRSAFWNELGGGLLSALALLPFEANRQFHLSHHSYAHQPGRDPENRMHQFPFWVAATAGSVLALLLQYRILFGYLWRLRDARYAIRLGKDLLSLTVAGMFYFILVPALGMSLSATVVPMLLALPLVFAWRALSDHYGIPAIERAVARGHHTELDADVWHRDREQRSREVSGWVILTQPWLEWLWSHVNFHEVHHKYPWLSHVHLRAVFEATCHHQPYLVMRGYWRSLWNLRRLRYYDRRERLRPFLTTPDW